MTTTKQRTESRSPFFVTFYRSAVAKKWLMAISGIVLLGFVFVHMLGNLHLYEAPERINEYAEGLRELGEPIVPREGLLWVLRLGLLGAFLIHLQAAWSLTVMNRKARPVSYQSQRDYIIASYASRTMRWTGVIVLLFILYHLLHLTFGVVHKDFIAGDVRHNLIVGFQQWPVALVYIAANVALAFHIWHGAWSMFQSLGVNNPRFNLWRRWLAHTITGVILIGNLSFPLAVATGLVT